MKLSNFATDYSDILAGGPATGATTYVSAHEAGTASMHVASAVTIADAGNYYTGSTVEAALQELGTAAGASTLVVYDESSLIGTPAAMKFAGDGVTATYSGGTATVTVTVGTASTNIPIYDEGTLMGTATSGLNFTGSGISGTVTSGTAVITVSSGGTYAGTAYTRTAGNYTTTSTSFVDVDSTNMALTITTGARRVMVGFVGSGGNQTVAKLIMLDVAVDGTRQGGAFGLVNAGADASDTKDRQNLSFTYLTDVLSAASHTFKLQFRIYDTGTAQINGSSSDAECRFWVQEMP